MVMDLRQDLPYRAEYAKSGRSKCKTCETKIDDKSLRMGFMVKSDSHDGMEVNWHHYECFFYKFRPKNVAEVAHFAHLRYEDHKRIEKSIADSLGVTTPAHTIDKRKRKRKADADEVPPIKKQKKQSNSEEKALKKQSDLIYKYIDNLESLKKPQLIELLRFNHLDIPDSKDLKIEILADSMAFGCTDKCMECSGQLVFGIISYICTGMANKWAKCDYQTDKPKRVAFKIPDELKKKYVFLNCYKYAKKDRLYVPSLLRALEAINSAAITSTQNSVLPKPEPSASSTKVLSNYKVVTVGKLKTTRNQLKSKIEKLGGQLASSVDRTVLCVISNKNEVEKETSKMMQTKDFGIPVVSKDFLDAAENGTNLEQAITVNVICDWAKHIEKRVANLNVNEKVSADQELLAEDIVRSGPTIQKMVIKEGNVVDPQSELEHLAHVFKVGSDVYNVILNKVDLTSNKNSYYKLQLLKQDNKEEYWVFRSWGRVGTTIGRSNLYEFSSKIAAIESFKDVYYKKTENNWDDRSKFVKQPNFYFPVDIDYGGKSHQLIQLQPGNSVLPKSIQELICMIFDVQQMKQAMLEFEINLEKMPLGKLSKKQLGRARSLLNKISNAIKSKSENNTNLVGLTNQFYSVVPHNFGVDKLPLIDSKETIANKWEMLEALRNIEISYKMISSIDANQEKDPIDLHYEKLNTTLEILDKSDGMMYDIIHRYVRNTHTSTHNMELDVLQVFRVERHGEFDRYKKFRDIDNRMLLWHGSRVTNLAGILSQGLRIAPPEAPAWGDMFGRGIYFADMVTKSAQYCRPKNNDNIGLLLLCEVAVGDPLELTRAYPWLKKLPSKPIKHSLKGCGTSEPDPNDVFVTEDGVKVPYGKPVVNSKYVDSELKYNEYVVYDSEQVNIKYLVMVKFNY